MIKILLLSLLLLSFFLTSFFLPLFSLVSTWRFVCALAPKKKCCIFLARSPSTSRAGSCRGSPRARRRRRRGARSSAGRGARSDAPDAPVSTSARAASARTRRSRCWSAGGAGCRAASRSSSPRTSRRRCRLHVRLRRPRRLPQSDRGSAIHGFARCPRDILRVRAGCA